MVEKLRKVWRDGNLIEWDEATVHLMTHSLHYGVAVFDGIRAYARADGATYVFRLREHVDRLFHSAKLCFLDAPFTRGAIAEACLDVVRANGMREGYLRPMFYVGEGTMGAYAPKNPVHGVVLAWTWASHLKGDAASAGIRAKISSFARLPPSAAMAKAKMAGQYTNGALARAEVNRAGYEEAILLDVHGYVSEASGSNVFVVRDGALHTPDLSCSILAGVTRDAVLTLAREMGWPVHEGRLTREDLWLADEVFLTGTAAEIVPVREIDDRAIGDGKVGPRTAAMQARFAAITRGDDTGHLEWLARV
jgi:branched-chain amino acid aminotransferase